MLNVKQGSCEYQLLKKMVEEAKRNHLDIVGVFSTKRRGSGTVNVDGG